MSSIDKRELREAAEKATPGPWEYYPGNTCIEYNVDSMVEDQGSIVYVDSGDFTQKQTDLNGAFIAAANPATVLALLDERERNLQYIKRRDQENEDIALTVGKLRVEYVDDMREKLEAAEKRIAELESGSQAQKLVEAIIVAIENEQERLFDEDYLMDSKECIDVIREEVKRWNDSRAAGIRIKGDAGEQNDEKP